MYAGPVPMRVAEFRRTSKSGGVKISTLAAIFYKNGEEKNQQVYKFHFSTTYIKIL